MNCTFCSLLYIVPRLTCWIDWIEIFAEVVFDGTTRWSGVKWTEEKIRIKGTFSQWISMFYYKFFKIDLSTIKLETLSNNRRWKMLTNLFLLEDYFQQICQKVFDQFICYNGFWIFETFVHDWNWNSKNQTWWILSRASNKFCKISLEVAVWMLTMGRGYKNYFRSHLENRNFETSNCLKGKKDASKLWFDDCKVSHPKLEWEISILDKTMKDVSEER